MRYVKCKCCGKQLEENSEVFVDQCNIGIFCSLLCWAKIYGIQRTKVKLLDDDLLECDGSEFIEG